MIFVLGLIWIIDCRKEIIKARQDKELKEQFEKWVRRTEDILYVILGSCILQVLKVKFQKAEIQVEKDKIDTI